MKLFKRAFSILLVLVLLACVCPVSYAKTGAQEATILFTHDLHSHLLPSKQDGGGEYGGYARLMTVINSQKAQYPDAVLLDAGDFSMGSLFQTGYTTTAIELRMMGAMGYDATTFGNHEFDYLPQGLVSMLRTAKDSGDPLPAIVDCNYLPPKEGEEGYEAMDAEVWDALDYYGVKDYVLLERGGVYFAVFGLVGVDSNACAPNSGMILEDPAVAAQRTVDAAKAECLEQYGAEPVVIALSHSGTDNGEGEDFELAQKVQGIHLIISGHTHSLLKKPIQVGNTYIVSAAEYGKNLGVVRFSVEQGETRLLEYALIPVDETVEEDPGIASLVADFKEEINTSYLDDYGMTYDQILVNNPYVFDSTDDVYNYAHESTLGNLFSDAYKWAAEQALGEEIAVALTASGVIRETMPVGDIRVCDVFNAASLGVGTEGELVSVYLTGSDLLNAFEVDASVYPLMHSAQLFYSGAEYSFNQNRMIFNKVDYAMLRRNDGSLEQIQPEKLYRVVTGMYMAQMLGSVESTSMGLLTVTPRDAKGDPIATADFPNYIVKDENGIPVKEWYAIAAYIDKMGDTMDAAYSETDGRKVVYVSWNPVMLLRTANKFTYILLAVILLLVLIAVLIVRAVIRRRRKKQKA